MLRALLSVASTSLHLSMLKDLLNSRIIAVMTVSAGGADWNSLARANAGQRWRKESSLMGREVTRAIVEAAQVAPGMRVLDVACGAGEPAISIAALLDGSGQVLGVDNAAGPLMTARERATQHGLSKIGFQLADVHSLPFPDNSFDRVTSRLGVMFFSDLPRALSEMRRVLRPDGKAALLAWGPIEQPYFAATLGTLLRLLPGASLPESGKKMFAFQRPGVLAQAFRDARFSAVEENFLTVPWTWPGSPEEVWEYFQDATVPFSPLLRSIPAGRRDEIDSEVVRAISRYSDGKEIKFTATVNITSAIK